MLVKFDLIKDAIQCCQDSDKNTRKFACFAVGNAGFHNDKLYEHLRPVIPNLVELLKDPEVLFIFFFKLAFFEFYKNIKRKKQEQMLQEHWEISFETQMYWQEI